VFATVLALWLPVELSLFPPLPRLGPVGVPLDKFVALAAGLWLFLVVRPMRTVGTARRRRCIGARRGSGVLRLRGCRRAARLRTRVSGWNPRADLALILLRPLLIYFTIGIPEEFLFRGVLQREIAGRIGDRWAIAVAAMIFGLAHAPSLAYIVLATLAGLAYGWVYHRTGRVAAAAVTHTLVDAVWVILLRP
jgi:membrane protease YdiL (CAAX protease family)